MSLSTEPHMWEEGSRYNGRSVCVPECHGGLSTVTHSSIAVSRDPHFGTGRVSLSPSPVIARFFIGSSEETVLDRAAHKTSGNYVMWIYLHYLVP